MRNEKVWSEFGLIFVSYYVIFVVFGHFVVGHFVVSHFVGHFVGHFVFGHFVKQNLSLSLESTEQHRATHITIVNILF